MALTSGFFNSKNHDRLYDATQISTLFEGLINDGVYQGVGNIFKVSASNGMNVTVDTGRAWFNNTWTRNDALIVLTVPTAEQVLKRIDAVVIEVNSLETVRNNTVKIVKGTPASNPAKPSLTKNDDVHQYPLAYITVDPNVTAITQQKIQNAVGTSACPFVTGIIDTLDIDNLIAQWSSEFNVLFAELEEKISQAASQTLIDKSVTEPKIANDAVVTRTVKDGVVTRAKLAQDALYSPIRIVQSDSNVVSSDVGATIRTDGSASAITVTLTQAVSHAMPVGTEIAFLPWAAATMKIAFDGIKVGVLDQTQAYLSPTFTLKHKGMIAIKKILSDSNVDYWLLSGLTEEVTT